MHEFVLILTLVFKSGYGGMGGVESMRFHTEEACTRVGEQWVRELERHKGERLREHEAFFQCIRISDPAPGPGR